MHFQHSDVLWVKFPQLRAAVIVISDIERLRPFDEVIAENLETARRRLEHDSESQLPEIKAWRDAYGRMGLKPTQYRCASEALLRRFRKEDALPTLHPLVDYLNAVSVRSAIPIAPFDIRFVTNGITVGEAIGNEVYDSFSGAVETPAEGEIVFADSAGVAHARRWVNRQSARSAVRADTDTALVIVEALHADAEVDLLAVCEMIVRQSSEHGARVVASDILRPDHRRFEF